MNYKVTVLAFLFMVLAIHVVNGTEIPHRMFRIRGVSSRSMAASP